MSLSSGVISGSDSSRINAFEQVPYKMRLLMNLDNFKAAYQSIRKSSSLLLNEGIKVYRIFSEFSPSSE